MQMVLVYDLAESVISDIPIFVGVLKGKYLNTILIPSTSVELIDTRLKIQVGV